MRYWIGTSATGTPSSKPAVGGLVSVASSGTIDRCYSDVKVNVGYFADAGGLVGRIASTTVKNSYSTTPAGSAADRAVYVVPTIITGSEEPSDGGLVGYCNIGNIINCYATRHFIILEA